MPLSTDGHLARLSPGIPGGRALQGILSAEEEKRASSFRFERDAVRYVIAHGALREILARYARQSPRELDFSAGAAGKPALEGIVPG